MTHYDNIIGWFKDNKIISFFMIIGIILIAIASVTDAISKIISFSIDALNPESIVSSVKTPRLCEKKIYQNITDANICGTKPSIITISPATPKKCTDTSFGRTGWKHSKRMRAICEWGIPPEGCCFIKKRKFIIDNSIEVDRLAVTHSVDKETQQNLLNDKLRSRYTCDFEVMWGSIYNSKVDPLCGMNLAITKIEQIPKTCKYLTGTEMVECK